MRNSLVVKFKNEVVYVGYFFWLYLFNTSIGRSIAVTSFVVITLLLFFQNLALALYFVFLGSSLFYLPLKGYQVTLINKNFDSSEYFSDGLIKIFGLTTSDVVALWIILFLLRKLVGKSYPQLKKIVVKHSIATIIFLSLLVFFLIEIINSFYSYFPFYSTVTALQSSKMLVAFTFTYYLLIKKKYKQILTYLSLLLILINVIAMVQLIFTLGGVQFYKQQFLIEESQFFARTTSVWEHANHYSIINSILLASAVILKKKAKLTNIWSNTAFLFSIIGIIIAQTRITWIALALVGLLYIYYQRKKLLNTLKSFKNHLTLTKASLAIITCSVLSVVVLQRLFTSFNADYEYGGIGIRKTMIEEGLKNINLVPYIGSGSGLSYVMIYSNDPTGYTSFFPHPPHFLPLQLALEAGLVAPFLFYFPFIFIGFRDRKFKTLDDLLVVSGIMLVLSYYLLQPSNLEGIDFSLLGIFLAICTIKRYELQANYKKS
jgi:hypothetical protein